jgi:hypothetical protein
LNSLTPEELFILLKNIALVHANGDPGQVVIPDEGVSAILGAANATLGDDYFSTPRDIVRSFIGFLNLLDQNPGKSWSEILEPGLLKPAPLARSAEEELATGGSPADEDLALVKL